MDILRLSKVSIFVISCALYFNANAQYFKPTIDGTWLKSERDYTKKYAKKFFKNA